MAIVFFQKFTRFQTARSAKRRATQREKESQVSAYNNRLIPPTNPTKGLGEFVGIGLNSPHRSGNLPDEDPTGLNRSRRARKNRDSKNIQT
jgi:hypothetical protein